MKNRQLWSTLSVTYYSILAITLSLISYATQGKPTELIGEQLTENTLKFDENKYPKFLKQHLNKINQETNTHSQLPPRNSRSQVLTVRSNIATGLNRLFGEPITTLGSYNNYGYTTIGVLNPEGQYASPLTADSAMDALVATMVDPEFLSSHGLKTLAEIPEHTLNISLRDVGMNSSLDGVSYNQQPRELEFEAYGPLGRAAQSEPYYPVTVEDWLSAKGRLRFTCLADGTSIVHAKFVNLIRHRMYSLWGFFDQEEVMPFDNFGPIRPLAGLPNLVPSSDAGVGEFLRVMNFCPMNLRGNEKSLVGVFLVFHSDQESTAGALSFTKNDRYPGNARHVQLYFPVTP